MRLTQHFSRIKADLPPPESEDGFLHEEGGNLPFQRGGRNLPFQEEESFLEDRPYSREEINRLFRENNMPDPMTYQGDEYDFTGKIGFTFKKPRTLSFEYSNHGTIDGEEVEKRIWVNIRGEVTSD